MLEIHFRYDKLIKIGKLAKKNLEGASANKRDVSMYAAEKNELSSVRREGNK